jgi:tRNA-specific 2-thiouridylase
MTQEQLAQSEFPLGEMTKQEVRALARARRLPVAEKPDSQEICFVPTGSYREFIEAYLAEQQRQVESRPGEVVSTDGRVLAEHQGLHNFTVGQRKGLGTAVGSPLYVIALDPAQNRVVVGEDCDLFRHRFLVREVNWIRPLSPGDAADAHVKIRHNHPGAAARVEALANSEARVEFLAPQRAITPGQAAVFYDGDEVLGGGWISRVL